MTFLKVEHGGNLRDFAKRFQIPEDEVMDFSSNVNPLGIPDSVRRVYLESADELSRYPDPLSEDLCAEIAAHFPVNVENVIAGNGAVSLLALAISGLRPRRALLLEPCFGEYRRLLEHEGAQVHSFFLKQEKGFGFELTGILEALRGMDLVILGHPNNPTGTALRRDELLELVAHAQNRNIFVIVDEAFADWMPEISIAGEVREKSNFLVVRSLTKFFALAGIRSGYALGPSSWILKMKDAQDTWSMNRIAQKLSVVALRDKDFQERSLGWFREESRWFFQRLKLLEGMTVYPSLANFYLVHCPHPTPLPQGEGRVRDNFFNFLAQRKICVRGAANFLGLDRSYFRVALRTRHDNECLTNGLSEWRRSLLPLSSIS